MFISTMSVFLSNQRNESIDFLRGGVSLSFSVPKHHFVVSGCSLCKGFKSTPVVLEIIFKMRLEYVDQHLYCM